MRPRTLNWLIIIMAALAAFLMVPGCAEPEIEVHRIRGTPPWVREVWRDEGTSLTCWGNGNYGHGAVVTCFRDATSCPAPVAVAP
jgi:hypothetical protein